MISDVSKDERGILKDKISHTCSRGIWFVVDVRGSQNLMILLHSTHLRFNINFLDETAQQVLLSHLSVVVKEIIKNILPDTSRPLSHILLVLPGQLQQPGQEVTGATSVHLPEYSRIDCYSNLSNQSLKNLFCNKLLMIYKRLSINDVMFFFRVIIP